MYLVDHDTLFSLDLIFREGRTCRKFEQQGRRFVEVFLQYRSMENYLLLGRECIELSAESVEVTVYHRRASVFCALEYGVLDKMSDAGMVASLVPRSALYAQRAVTYS